MTALATTPAQPLSPISTPSSPNIARMLVPLDGMHSPGCAKAVDRSLSKLPGVTPVTNYAAGLLMLTFDRTQCPLPTIVTRLDKLGYRARFERAQLLDLPPEWAATREEEDQTLWSVGGAIALLRREPSLAIVLGGGVLLLAGWLVGTLGDSWGPARWVLLGMSAVCTSHETFFEAARTLRRFRLDVDLMMFAAAIGAASLGKGEEGALLLFLFGLGSVGEHIALGRARSAIDQLSAHAPQTAERLLPDGRTVTVPIGQIAPGDLLLVKPFSRIAADAVVHEGSSAVDQAMVTGESVPVTKEVGDTLFAGTMNTGGKLIIQATRVAGESTMARIQRAIEEAQTRRSSVQMLTEKVEAFYVPLVFVATAALIFLPPWLGSMARGVAFYRAMAFLTAASPCALAIGTPASMLCAIAAAARGGVLLKGGEALERLARLKAMAFDKTGTLTTGKLKVTDVIPAAGFTEAELLRVTSAIEQGSTHPLSDAVMHHIKEKGITPALATNVHQVAGQGIVGEVEGHNVSVGKGKLVAEDPTLAPALKRLGDDGRSLIGVVIDSRPAGLLALSDEPRPSTVGLKQKLAQAGVEHTYMLSGDHQGAVEAMARRCEIMHAEGQLLPEQKLKRLSEIRAERGPVGMVGDGVNDGPALAAADLGFAMGGSGSDVAIETADVVLMGGDLARIPWIITLARHARVVIAQNLVIALGTICIVAPLAALGHTPLGVAVLLHEGSTIVVVLSSLRLLKHHQ